MKWFARRQIGLRFTALSAAAVLLSVTCAMRSADGAFAITSSTVDCGGGRMSGATLTLSGTIGQPDAGTLSGVSITLTGGFWGGGVQAPPCPADTDSDGDVDTDDFINVLVGWGSCAAPCPPTCDADVNDDCTVDTDDFIGVLVGWGACL